MSDEWIEFSKRLQKAMQARGHEPRAGVLHKQFNSSYDGESVTFQTASRWLNGEGIPRHDKLLQLARMYAIDPCLLLFGDPSTRKSREAEQINEDPAVYEEREWLDALRMLFPSQRRLVLDLIKELTARNSR